MNQRKSNLRTGDPGRRPAMKRENRRLLKQTGGYAACCWSIPSRISDPERLAAPAFVLDVRVVEFEAFVQPLAREIELRAVDVRQAFRIDDHLDAMTLEDTVFGRQFIDVLE